MPALPHRCAFLMIGLVFLAAGAAPPATRPAAIAATPAQFQEIYRDAVRAADAAALRSMFLTRTPGESAVVDIEIATELDVARRTAAVEQTFGVKLVGGGTLTPVADAGTWEIAGEIAGDLATWRDAGRRNDGRPRFPPLRKVGGAYKIDLVAWGMNWMDAPGAEESRKRMNVERPGGDPMFDALKEGRYRSLEEFRECGHSGANFARAPDSPVGNPPRPFRRPVKIDLTTPPAARRSIHLAAAEGDRDAFLRCLEFVDPVDKLSMTVFARHITAFISLQEAAERKFGRTHGWFGVPAELPSPRIDALMALAELDEFEHAPQAERDETLIVRGDEATWKESGEPAAEMVRINGQWRTRSRLKSEVGQKDEDPNDWTQIYTMVAQVEESFAKRIAAGEFATEEQARAEMDRASRQAKPATRTAAILP